MSALLHLFIQYSGNSSQIEATKDDTMRFHTSSLSPTISMGNYHCARVSELSPVCNVRILVCFICFFWFLCYCNNAIVLLSGIIVYLLKKYIFYCFWNNLFDNLTSSCIVIVYRSEQQIKFWWLVEFLIWKKEGTKPAQLVFCKCVITQETLKFFFLEIEWITEIYDKQTW